MYNVKAWTGLTLEETVQAAEGSQTGSLVHGAQPTTPWSGWLNDRTGRQWTTSRGVVDAETSSTGRRTCGVIRLSFWCCSVGYCVDLACRRRRRRLADTGTRPTTTSTRRRRSRKWRHHPAEPRTMTSESRSVGDTTTTDARLRQRRRQRLLTRRVSDRRARRTRRSVTESFASWLTSYNGQVASAA